VGFVSASLSVSDMTDIMETHKMKSDSDLPCPKDEATVRRWVQKRIAEALELAARDLWAGRGGIHFLEPDEALEFAEIVGRMQRLGQTLAQKANAT
jgi:hypothetical protein